MPPPEPDCAATIGRILVDTTSQLRTCPACGAQTADDHCPADGTRTLHMQPLRADATQLFAGELVADRYRVTEVLGRGGFGAVYRAVHTGTRQAVALKLLHVRDAADGGFDQTDARRFFREAEITASLRHPNTVRVFDLGQTDRGALYLAMELLEGDTLDAQLRKLALAGQWMPLDDVLRVACDVLGSLGEAHDRGLVHRDLKPANLMLTTVAGDPVTKVLDFGIARQAGSSLTTGNSAVGTPQYMAPEQCMGQALDGRADLYALGVILFRCLSGSLPFDDPNPMTVMMKQVADPAPDLLARTGARVPRRLGQAVAVALAKDPGERFADARSMRAALLAAMAATPHQPLAVVAAPVGPATAPLAPLATPNTGATPAAAAVARVPAIATAQRWHAGARGRRPGLAASAVVAVALAAGTAWWWTRPAPSTAASAFAEQGESYPAAGAPRATPPAVPAPALAELPQSLAAAPPVSAALAPAPAPTSAAAPASAVEAPPSAAA
ncbi:MAG: serine/threonine protein kinase, partial [Deltaproteobacteria bacterium]|nr:serine/threonine protein kinase [Deltaproteobacteria bacterium]